MDMLYYKVKYIKNIEKKIPAKEAGFKYKTPEGPWVLRKQK